MTTTTGTLDSYLDRVIAERLGLPVDVVRENLGKCHCCWSVEFRAKMNAAAAESGNKHPSWAHSQIGRT